MPMKKKGKKAISGDGAEMMKGKPEAGMMKKKKMMKKKRAGKGGY